MPQVVYNKTKGLVQSTGNGFNLEGQTSGYGRHILVEEIELTLANATCAGNMTRSLPAGAILVGMTATVSGKGTSAGQTMNVFISDAAAAVGDAVGSLTNGVEIIGAGAGATTFPNGADIDPGSGGVLGDSQLNNIPLDRASAATFIHVFNAGNNTADTGTPKLTIQLEWIGGPSVAA